VFAEASTQKILQGAFGTRPMAITQFNDYTA
jgi:hypothetical protein